MQATRLYTVLMVSFFFTATASAQLFDSGPSDPTRFTNVINLPGDDVPSSIGGSFLETTQLNVAIGGSVGSSFNAGIGSELNIIGGVVGNHCRANRGSEANVTGGSVGDNFSCFDSEVNISGGSVGDNFSVSNFSEVNISGGSVGDFFEASDRSVINISGGSVGDRFTACAGSTINLIGSVFILDAVVLTNLNAGEAFTIVDRDVTLVGRLADGSTFSFELNSFSDSQDQFEDGSTLTVTLTPVSPQIDLTVAIDNPRQTVGPEDIVELNVTLTNETTSTLPLSAVRNTGASFFSGNLVGAGRPYQSRFSRLKDGTELLPGESISLLFATFTPDPGPVTPGVYSSQGLSYFFDNGDSEVRIFSSTGFEITVVAEPESIVLGDVNQDDAVNFLDISPFIAILSAGDYLAEADINEDGNVNFLDISPFVLLLLRSSKGTA